ncbi:MAG: hypothetical protein GF331_11850 [Chitinivibrionales bacterium]|nr:hypothetical protein [Chitinivibrionales bacterium]
MNMLTALVCLAVSGVALWRLVKALATRKVVHFGQTIGYRRHKVAFVYQIALHLLFVLVVPPVCIVVLVHEWKQMRLPSTSFTPALDVGFDGRFIDSSRLAIDRRYGWGTVDESGMCVDGFGLLQEYRLVSLDTTIGSVVNDTAVAVHRRADGKWLLMQWEKRVDTLDVRFHHDSSVTLSIHRPLGPEVPYPVSGGKFFRDPQRRGRT